MKVLERQQSDWVDLPDAEALITEARQRQRRRWTFGSIVMLMAIVIGCVAYVVVSRATKSASHTGTSSPTKTTPAVRSHPVMAYVLSSASGTVTPINTVTNAAGRAILVGTQAKYLGVSLDGKTLYVGSGDLSTNANANVIPIPVGTNRAGKPVKLSLVKMGAWCATDVATTPNGKTDYLDVPSEGIVLPITVATGVAGKPIRVGPGASEIVIVG